MTVKYFGEFLVEKGVIKQDVLVHALIEQMSKMPPLAQVSLDNNILNIDQLSLVFREQQDRKIDFVSACKSLGLWTEKVEVSLSKSMDEKRIPLGQILISKSAIDLKTLTHMLDEFLSQADVKAEEEKLPEVKMITEESVISEDEVEIQPGLLMELDEMFDERKKKVVRVALSLIKENANDSVRVAKLYQDIFKVIHTLNGLVSLLGLMEMGKLVEEMEKLISNQNEESTADATRNVKMSECLTEATDELWNLRNNILKYSGEKKHFNEADNKKKFEDVLRALKDLS